jgi:hypothetical protein
VPEKAGDSFVPTLTVAGVTMTDGDYLKTNVYVPTKEKPADGGYAYYKDGVLTLFNYRHVSGGTPAPFLPTSKGTALIHSTGSLTLKLEGESYLESTDTDFGALVLTEDGDLKVIGDGKLEGKSVYGLTSNDKKLSVTDATLKLHVLESKDYYLREANGIYASGDINVDNANIEITCDDDYIDAISAGQIIIDNSTVSVMSEVDFAMYANAFRCNVYVTDSTLSVTNVYGGFYGVDYAENTKFITDDVGYAFDSYKKLFVKFTI